MMFVAQITKRLIIKIGICRRTNEFKYYDFTGAEGLSRRSSFLSCYLIHISSIPPKDYARKLLNLINSSLKRYSLGTMSSN